jgi:hypothetical protein
MKRINQKVKAQNHENIKRVSFYQPDQSMRKNKKCK